MASTLLDEQVCANSQQCQVCIDGNTITVSCEKDGKQVTYQGEVVSDCDNLYKLAVVFPEGKRRTATLKRSLIQDDLLEGYWLEDGMNGFWRIQLNK